METDTRWLDQSTISQRDWRGSLATLSVVQVRGKRMTIRFGVDLYGRHLSHNESSVGSSPDMFDMMSRANYDMLHRGSPRYRSREQHAMPHHPTAVRHRASSFTQPGQPGHPGQYFHDPLFGSNTVPSRHNTSPFSDSEAISSHYSHGDFGLRPRSHSQDRTTSFGDEESESTPDLELLHKSMPNLAAESTKRDLEELDLALFHKSMPNLRGGATELGDTDVSESDLEPLPLHSIRSGPVKTTGDVEMEMKPPRAVPVYTPSSSRLEGNLSKDLMECLDKLTEHTISDDNPFSDENPFEPIPLKALSSKEPEATTSLPPEDETALEFGEG